MCRFVLFLLLLLFFSCVASRSGQLWHEVARALAQAPLLGFRYLHPAFCIQRVEDATRIPTASTCFNLLKLPQFQDFDTMSEKLTHAIAANSGFGLS